VGNYGWAYVAGGGGEPGGISGSVQLFKDAVTQTGSADFTFTEDTVTITGSVYVSGTLTANQYNINVVNETVTNISASGDTKFGNSTDDTHIFTGSILLTSSTNPLKIRGIQTGAGSTFAHYLALDSNNLVVLTSSVPAGGAGLIKEYTNPSNNRIITSIDSDGINAEANFTFNGTNLSLIGSLTASLDISSSTAQFTHLTGTTITDGTALLTGGDLSSVGTVTATNLGGTLTTAAQGNVTSLGTLTTLTCSGDLQVDTDTLNVNSTTNKIGIGRIHAQKKLEVLDANEQLRLSYSKYIFGVSNNVYTDVYTTNTGYLILTASAQRVGIGTATPSRMLDVNGHMRVSGNLEITGTLSARVTDFVVSANTITFGDSSTDQLTFNAATASIPNDLNFASGLLSLDNANSKVGIGVQYPDNKLEVLSTAAQLKLSYNESKGSTLGVDSNGFLTVTPSGDWLTASCNLFVSGNTILGTDASSTVTITGALTSSVGFSGSHGLFTQLTASHVKVVSLTDGTATMTGGNISGVGTLTATNLAGTLATAAQPNVTSLGTLTTLSCSGQSYLSGNVGIGVPDAAKKLEVLDGTGLAQLRLTYQRLAGFNPLIMTDLQTTSTGHLVLSASGGRVGIGTSSPTRMLDVNGHMRVSGNLEVSGSLHAKVSEFIVSANNITFGDASTDTLTFNAASASAPNGLNYDSNTWVLDTGNNRVGIGTAHPTYTLDVGGNIGVDEFIYHNGDDNTYIRFQADQAHIKAGGKSMIKMDEAGANSVILLNKDKDSIKVGIGTETPETDLHVSGAVIITETLAVTGSITGSSLTDGTATMTGGDISGVGTLTATNVGGTLTTPAQANVTSLGTLTGLTVTGDVNFNSNALFAKNSNSRIGIGRDDPTRPLEVLNTAPQLRLSYSKFVFGVSANVFSDLYTDSSGYLILTASSERVGIGTAKPTSTLALSGTLNVSSSGNPVKILGLLTGSLAGPGSYLGIDTTGQIVLTSSAGGSGGGGSTTVNGPLSTNDVLVEGYNYFTTISSPTIVSLPSASIGAVVHIKAGPGTSATNYIRISGSQSGDTIDGVNHIDMESPYGALAFIYVASNKDWRIL